MKYQPITIESLRSIFKLDDVQMQRREKVGTYIHSFAALVYDRMYNHYLLKDATYHGILSASDVPRLVRMQSEYFSSLFIHPFDQRIIDRTRQIGEIHIAVGLESIHVARGFDILTEIILDLSKVNTQIGEDITIILKMLRISEVIMNESYFESYREHQSVVTKENEMLAVFDTLYSALMIHKQSQKKITDFWFEERSHVTSTSAALGLFSDENSCPFSAALNEIESKRGILDGFGVDIDEARSLHHRYHEHIDTLLEMGGGDSPESEAIFHEIEAISSALYAVIDKPLADISATSYLGIHSGIEFLQACTQSMLEGGAARDPEEILDNVQEKLHEQLKQILGWCIDELHVGIGEIPRNVKFDVTGKIILKNKRINIAVAIKEIPNKIYMVEIIKILVEIMRQSFHNREREYALIQLVDEVERASQSKNMFLANMSHELRTPLNAIIGFSQILMMNKSLPDNLHPYIQKISIAGNNLLTLVNTILDFAKLEAGKLNFKPEMTLLSTIMNDVSTIVEPMAQKKSITFTYPEMISLGLYLDRQLIMQVLINLLSNAVKFTPEGGTVSLHVEYEEAKKAYRLGICDNGVGISPKDITTLFDPFTQVENPFQKTAKGTGLGLAISKRIIEDLHGGAIWVESEVGKGSCFYFTIPVSQTQNTIERFVAENPDAKRVLVVEDAPEYQKVLIDRLSSEFHLSVTNSVNKAKELLDDEPFDFIILDFFLVDGISSEVIQHMEGNGINIPIIIISAEDDSKLIAHLPDAENVEGIFNKSNISEICDYLSKRIN
ncbi:MAG: ATP-binding protein [Sulfuricurvum sp.]|nr:ATP-binding protein [Sulfuricurvum sp.]